MRFYPLEKLINLHDNYTREFKIDHLRLLLMQRRGQLYLCEARCPHRDHPLHAATIEDGVLQCPLHHYSFSLADGRLLRAGEEPCRGLRVYAPVYEGNEVGEVLDDEG